MELLRCYLSHHATILKETETVKKTQKNWYLSLAPMLVGILHPVTGVPDPRVQWRQLLPVPFAYGGKRGQPCAFCKYNGIYIIQSPFNFNFQLKVMLKLRCLLFTLKLSDNIIENAFSRGSASLHVLVSLGFSPYVWRDAPVYTLWSLLIDRLLFLSYCDLRQVSEISTLWISFLVCFWFLVWACSTTRHRIKHQNMDFNRLAKRCSKTKQKYFHIFYWYIINHIFHMIYCYF